MEATTVSLERSGVEGHSMALTAYAHVVLDVRLPSALALFIPAVRRQPFGGVF